MQTHIRRRWLRFSLRGLLIVVTLVAVWLGSNATIARQRRETPFRLIELPLNVTVKADRPEPVKGSGGPPPQRLTRPPSRSAGEQ
jgi:hypothetical protein